MNKQLELSLPVPTKPEPMLWLSDSRGQYIPRDFASSFADRAKSVSGVSDEDWAILEAGPDHAHYWEAWEDVEARAVVTDDNGAKYTIYLDGNCWLIPEGMLWDDEANFFVWPAKEEDDEGVTFAEIADWIEKNYEQL